MIQPVVIGQNLPENERNNQPEQPRVQPVGGANCVPPRQQEAAPAENRNHLTLNVLDLAGVIDIYAEGKAVEAFEEEMRRKGEGMFKKVSGFFRRSFQRMGRDAWIEGKKQELIRKIQDDLQHNRINEAFLRNQIDSGMIGIEEKNYLQHEVLVENQDTHAQIQQIVDTFFNAPQGSRDRDQVVVNLKNALQQHYPKTTTSLDQLERALLQLEQAKLQSEVEVIVSKLNILDIGRINQGGGKRVHGFLVSAADSIAKSIQNSNFLSQSAKEVLGGIIRHPNTGAILAALGTRGAIGAVSLGATASLLGGFLAPVIAGSIAGGIFAGVRAKREFRDRTNQIDRRGALGNETGNTAVDGNSSNASVHNTQAYQASVATSCHRLGELCTIPNRSAEQTEEALSISLCYLIRHKIGREKNINLLRFTNGESVTQEQFAMIRNIRALFPNLIIEFNTNTLPEAIQSDADTLTHTLNATVSAVLADRKTAEDSYGLKQGVIFGATALAVGSSIQGILSLTHSESATTPLATTPPSTPIAHSSSNLQEITNFKRVGWYDNKTLAPKFEHTELGIHAHKGEWDIRSMLGKTTNGTLLKDYHIQTADLRGIVTLSDGKSYALPIDTSGKIIIPSELQSIFDGKSFKFFEVAQMVSDSEIRPIATVKGSGSGILALVPPPQAIPESPAITPQNPGNFIAIPFGGTPYDPLGKRRRPEINEAAIAPQNPQVPPAEAPAIAPAPQAPVAPDRPLEQYTNDEIAEEITTLTHTTLPTLGIDHPEYRAATSKLRRLDREYDTRRKNNQIQQQREEIPQKKLYENAVNSLMHRGTLAHKQGKLLVQEYFGRPIVFATLKSGKILPMYRSKYGTSGKKQNAWYPCFGWTDDRDWLIKGTLSQMNSGYGSAEIQAIQDTLNTSLNWDPKHNISNEKIPLGDFTSNQCEWMDMNELEKEQSSKKPTSTTDAASTEWMDEWIARVTGAPKKPRNPNKGPSTSGAAAAMAMDIPEKNDVSQQAIDIYTFFLGNEQEAQDPKIYQQYPHKKTFIETVLREKSFEGLKRDSEQASQNLIDRIAASKNKGTLERPNLQFFFYIYAILYTKMRHPEAKMVVDGIGDFKDIVVQQDTLNELAINLTAGIYFLNSTVDSVSPEMHLDGASANTVEKITAFGKKYL